MNRDLSPAERKVLQGILAELRFSSRVVRKVKATDRRILMWCEAQDLLPLGGADGSEFGFTEELIKVIERCLQQLGLAALDADLKVSTLVQAQQGGAEHKSVRSKPRDHRVLRYVLAADLGVGQVVDVDYRELELAAFADLVVVENLDCFYELSQFQLSLMRASAASSLVVYRGDSHYGKGRAALMERWRTVATKPLRYFGDLDPKGFHIAQREGFTHLAVPAFEWFVAHATAQAYPTKQHDLAEQLYAGGAIAPFVDYLRRHQSGVLQQWLQGIPLRWVPVNGPE